MTIELTSSFLDVIHPARLLGPIFNKELRVCSRRRRNYVLRCVYIAALSVFILYAWYAIAGARSASSAIYQTSRSAQVGRTVIAYIVWFQFIVAQLIAIVMLSSCISDEIRAGTLAVLAQRHVDRLLGDGLFLVPFLLGFRHILGVVRKLTAKSRRAGFRNRANIVEDLQSAFLDDPSRHAIDSP